RVSKINNLDSSGSGLVIFCIFAPPVPSYSSKRDRNVETQMAWEADNQRVSSASTAAFEAEALPHLNDLFRAAVRLLLDHAKANDAVQETYLVAWKSFGRYQSGT